MMEPKQPLFRDAFVYHAGATTFARFTRECERSRQPTRRCATLSRAAHAKSNRIELIQRDARVKREIEAKFSVHELKPSSTCLKCGAWREWRTIVVAYGGSHDYY